MFRKLVAIEPIHLDPHSEKELQKLAKEVQLYSDLPTDDQGIIRRIGDADGVLLSYTSRINAQVIAACPSIQYIGMSCSL